MIGGLAADLVVVVHLGFIVFVVAVNLAVYGIVLARRRRAGGGEGQRDARSQR